MPVPDFQSLMLPILRSLKVKEGLSISEIRNRVAKIEGLTDEDLREDLPRSNQKIFVNRVSWAITHMMRAGLLDRVNRAVYQLNKEGEKLLSQNPTRINKQVLKNYPKYLEWNENIKPSQEITSLNQGEEISETPEETLGKTIQYLNNTLEADVLNRVTNATPDFLEKLVVDLLIAMGYGGGDATMGNVTGRSGDGGIDGIIREDSLGLDEVYLQAKKYSQHNNVGENDLRNFAGAIDAANTIKGVFVTTSSFTPAAKAYVKKSPKRIVLIDGKELARLMVQYGIGVRTKIYHEIKRIDEDYFVQETS